MLQLARLLLLVLVLLALEQTEEADGGEGAEEKEEEDDHHDDDGCRKRFSLIYSSNRNRTLTYQSSLHVDPDPVPFRWHPAAVSLPQQSR